MNALPRTVIVGALALAASSSLAEPRRPSPPPPPMDFAPPPAVVAPGGTCGATLVVRYTATRGGCVIDERVTRAPGRLEFPCQGGPATATFGDSQFVGTVMGTTVNLALRTRFHFTDGCDWESVQGITGDLARGALAYSYAEAPLPGQSRCASACRAAATVEVAR